MLPWYLQPSFSSIRHKVFEEMSFEEFQETGYGGHLRYWNWMILAILKLHVAMIPSAKFQFNPTYGLGGDVVWRISRSRLWWPSSILKLNDFSNSETPCCPDYGFNQVLVQSDIWFGKCHWMIITVKFGEIPLGLGGDVVWSTCKLLTVTEWRTGGWTTRRTFFDHKSYGSGELKTTRTGIGIPTKRIMIQIKSSQLYPIINFL